MGDSIEQWRATTGQWTGGRRRQCVTLQHQITQTSNNIGYRHIRFLVLVSLLVIGCVELNPGPDHKTSAPTQSAGALPKFSRRRGTYGQHGEQYEVKTAEFLFTRALYKTEEFQLASNIVGAGSFDDLVFRYRLRESDVWKTCFLQLKHKKYGSTIQRSCLTNMSEDFSLFKFYKSYCEINKNAATEPNLKQCGPFVDFEFVIYTNANMEGDFTLQGGDSDPLSILSSGTDYGKYIAFVEYLDTDIFRYFSDLSKNQGDLKGVEGLLRTRRSLNSKIDEKLKEILNFKSNAKTLEKMSRVKSYISQDNAAKLTKEVLKCDFKLYKEFLKKVKIFHSQSNVASLKGLIEKELQQACKASPSVANFIYTKFEESFPKWWERDGEVEWLNKHSELWQEVQEYIITEIKNTSKLEFQENNGCGIRFNEQHVQKLSDAIEQNNVLNIVTNSKVRILQKVKTYQALKILDYKNSLFISIKSLMSPGKEINELWPCEWSKVLVVDCDSDDYVARRVLYILKQSAERGQGLDNSDSSTVEALDNVLQKYQQKLILISQRKENSVFKEKLRNIYNYCGDNFEFSDLDEKSQKQILERPINFQGTKVALLTLVGTDPPESIKSLLHSDVISILLSNEHELTVGRHLDDHPKNYLPRELQHHIYLKKDILKLTNSAITFAVSGLQANELKKYLPADEKIFVLVYDERERHHTFKIVCNFSKTGLSAELESIKAYNEAGQDVKPEQVRYIILGNKNPEIEFRELKNLYRNVHWIHVEEDSFLWRDTNSQIDIIRRYIDNTKCEKYDMKSVVEHKGRTMLLVAEPGMGKSTFLSYMEPEIKKWYPSVWVLRINLNEHTDKFEGTYFENECVDKCKNFLWSAAHSPKQDALEVAKEIFLQALEQTGKMVVILDGFDEISPDYSSKVKMLIRAIRDKTASKVWMSSRFCYRQDLEDVVGKFALTLQPFTPGNQIQFLEQYWSEVTKISNRGNLQEFAKKILSLCSQNFNDKDGEFTGIPLQTMMLGEAFVDEVKRYCCSGEFNLPEKFNLFSLFKRFIQKKFDIYFREKTKMVSTKIGVKMLKAHYEDKHMISALISVLSLNEFDRILGAINVSDLEQTNLFLQTGMADKFGIITSTMNGKPYFIHRCFAEYFAAKWFTAHFEKCEEFISNILFNSTNETTRNIFDRMLAEDCEIHDSVLNNDIHNIKGILKKKTDINTLDKGGRTALHLAATYNNPYIQHLLSFPGIDTNKPDKVLKWTPLKYADRTKSWMAMDILLRNRANPEDIVFTRHNAKDQEWGQTALWECATKGYIKLLEFMLNCGHHANESVDVLENLNEKRNLLHRASYCGQVEVVRFIFNRGADINIRDAKKNTALHLAAESGNVNIIELLLDKGMSVNLSNTEDSTPLHVSAEFGHLEATKALFGRGADINYSNTYGDTPLTLATRKGKVDVCWFLTEGVHMSISDA